MNIPKQPSSKWSAEWSELKGLIQSEFPVEARRHHCGVFSSEPKPVSIGTNGTEAVEMSVEVIFAERRATLTLVYEGCPDNGFAISIFSLFGVFRSYRMFDGQSIRSAVSDVMDKVGQVIEEFKGGAPERRLFG